MVISVFQTASCNLERQSSTGRGAEVPLERTAIEGDSPVRGAATYPACLRRVGLFCIAALSGR